MSQNGRRRSASASTKARLLKLSGVIKSSIKERDRNAVYQLKAHPYARMMDVIAQRVGKLALLVDTTRAEIAEAREEAEAHPRELSDFYGDLLAAFGLFTADP